jgi:hypothetical protein
MLAEQDLRQVQEYVLQVLPQLLQQNPEVATTIEGMIAHQFPRRDEFARLLEEVGHLWEEIKLLREDTNKQFELFRQEMNQLREDTNKQFKLFREEMNQLREDTNKQFELFREEMNRRFEEEKRERNLRFEEEKRERLEMKRRLIKVESTVNRMDEKITQFDAWLKIVTGNIGDKRGQEAEQLFALGLSYGLKWADIKPETIKLRQMFMDEEGVVFPKKGKYIEVDIISENGKFSVFEVKTTAVETDVVTFARKIQLVQHQMPNKEVQGIFISPGASEEIEQCCKEYDVEFVG